MSTDSTHNNDRVQQATSSSTNRQIEAETWERVAAYRDKTPEEISARIEELNEEWDIELYLGVNMSSLALSGLAVAAITRNRSWNILPAVVLAFFFQHSVQGWCPPLPILRKFKIRTSKEIEQEKYALKVMRGDFKNLTGIVTPETSLVKQAIQKS